MEQREYLREAENAAPAAAAQEAVQPAGEAVPCGGKPRKGKNASIFNGRARIFVICMLAYAVVNFAIFYVWMNIDSILLAFKTYNGTTGKQEYLAIVRALAADAGLKTDGEELALLAERWALVRGGRSPRRARQFVDYLYACERKGKKAEV